MAYVSTRTLYVLVHGLVGPSVPDIRMRALKVSEISLQAAGSMHYLKLGSLYYLS